MKSAADSRRLTMGRTLSRLSLPGSVRQWHWVSSAICLIGMLGFAITGITLNHAGDIPARPVVTSVEAELPAPVLNALLESQSVPGVPTMLRRWLASEKGIYLPPSSQFEWSDDELYVAMPQPGGDAWLSVDLMTGEMLFEHTSRGWVSYFNDLHKGRNTGAAWAWFIDIFAGICVVFSISGLLLLQRQAQRRPSTWPAVALGLLIPFLLIILFVH